MKYSELKTRISRHLTPHGPVVALIALGSQLNDSATDNSDVDLLVIVEDSTDGKALIKLGRDLRDGLRCSFPSDEIVFFDSPGLDRPNLYPEGALRVHLLVHRWSWVRKSLQAKNWVFVNWSRNHQLIVGKDVFNRKIIPELNQSIVDEFDGLPAIVRRIDYELITSDPTHSPDYYKKLTRYSWNTLDELTSTFPELGSLPQRRVCDELHGLLSVRDILLEWVQRVIAIVGRSSKDYT